jgi:hypothetical protein
MVRPWQHVPNIRRWHFRFLKLAFRDTLTFFWQQMLVGVLVAIVAAFFEHLGTAALLGLIINLGILLVSFILNAIRTPVKLDNHREIRADLLRKSARRRIAKRDIEIERLKAEIENLKTPPIRSLADQHHFDILKAVIDARGDDARRMLRHLRGQGPFSFRVDAAKGRVSANTPLPPNMDCGQAYLISGLLVIDGVLKRARLPGQMGHDEIFEIAPGFISVVDELIYPAGRLER